MLATKPTNGVAPKPRAGNWPATITHAGRRIRIGTFATLGEAVKAHIEAATRLKHDPADDIRDAIAAWANADP